MTINQDIINGALPYVQTVILAILPVIATWAAAELRRRGVNDTVVQALGRAGGEAYKQLVTKSATITDVTSLENAIHTGTAYMQKMIPDTLHNAGITPDAIGSMVSAELGKLLAADPTVSVSKPAAPPPPAVVPVQVTVPTNAPAGTVLLASTPVPVLGRVSQPGDQT